MSLDLYLTIPAKCPHCGGTLRFEESTILWDRNYTHNGIPMWNKAGVYFALYESDGHLASEYISDLEKGVADFRANFAEYEKLDSPNGWGLAKHALPFLEAALEAFKANPDATIRVSR